MCKNLFEITDADRVFLRKFEVPDPKLCPPCREQRRWSFRNERTLYPRTCDLCGRQMVSIFAKDKPYKAYCPECFHGDKWDAVTYGRDFYFSQPFFPQFKKLLEEVPHLGRLGFNNVNSEYVHLETDDKDCYLNFGGHWNERCFYNTFALKCHDVMDNYWIFESELCYDCNDAFRSYECYYSQNIHNSRNLWFCFDCRNSENCFGCFNLRGAKYQILNEQYTKENYERKVKELMDGYRAIESARDRVREHGKKFPRRFAATTQIENSTGNHLTQCKDVIHGFDVEQGENLRNVYIAAWLKDCMDVTCIGKSQNCYECLAVLPAANCRFTVFCFPEATSFIDYSYECLTSENLFGCVGVRHGKYMIMNKQYSPQDYEALRTKIIEHMRKTGEWGEFFPTELSLFGYNETIANLYFPMTKDEVIARGWKWYDGAHGTFGKETLQPEAIPDRIEDVTEDILKHMLRCVSCNRNYTVIKGELAFYRKNHLPIPRMCYECRHRARLALRNPHKLWHRACMCQIGGQGSEVRGQKYTNTTTHFHGASPCPNEFETSYAPERPETIFCEQCFNAEVL